MKLCSFYKQDGKIAAGIVTEKGIVPLEELGVSKTVSQVISEGDSALYEIEAALTNCEADCDGIHIGGKHHQRIHIGHRRTDKAVASGEDFLHHALVLFPGNGDQIAGEGGIALPAQDAPGAAGNDLPGQLHIIKTADGADDSSLAFISHFSTPPFWC